MSSVVLLKAVKEKLGTLGIDAFIIGSGDAHQSEYVHESDMRRAFVSKFDGSSGTALILKDKNEAYLWTDGRYFLQASKQLSSYWTLMRSGEPNVLEINDWILTNCPKGTIIGIDPYLVSASQALAMEKLFSSRGMSLKPVERNPIDEVWGDDKPTPPNSPIIIHPLDHAGVPYTEKISLLQKELEKQKCVAFVVTMLDEVLRYYVIIQL
jgi:Xaa-Pro aminopeptidase